MNNINILRDIVDGATSKALKFKDGSMRVDLFTASTIVQVFNLLKKNKANPKVKQFEEMLNDSKKSFQKVATFSFNVSSKFN